MTTSQCHHFKVRHSPNGVDIIEECEECCKAWIVKPTGEIWRLWHSSYERRLTEQKLARELRDGRREVLDLVETEARQQEGC